MEYITLFCGGNFVLNSGNDFVDFCHQLLLSAPQKSFVRLPEVIRLSRNAGNFDYEEQKGERTGGGEGSIVAWFPFNKI